MKFKIYLLLILILLFVSCETKEDQEEKAINLNIKWTAPVTSGGSKMYIEYNTIYTSTSYGFCAINADTGKIIWNVDNILKNATNSVIDEKYLYCLGYHLNDNDNQFLYCVQVDKLSGQIISDKIVGEGWTEQRPRVGILNIYNSTLFWAGANGNIYAYSPLEPDSKTILISENDTGTDEKRDIFSDIIFSDSILYFSYDRLEAVPEIEPYDIPTNPFLVALDMNNNYSQIFKKKYLFSRGTFTENTIWIDKEKMYLSNGFGGNYGGVICIDKKTGDIIWSNTEIDAGTAFGFTLYDNVIYVVSTWDEKNVFAIDAKTGKMLWWKTLNARKYGTFGYSPQVYKGIMYIPSQKYMIVLNAVNGDLIGYDYNLPTGGLSVGITEMYKDTMIIKTIQDKMYSVKMDVHTW